MKTLSINGVIGWDVTSKDFISKLDELGGEDFTLEIHSPGGSVFEGLAIYNKLKTYTGKVDTKIIGVAASMASIIALAKGKPKIAKSAVFMIHNAQGMQAGDYRDFKKYAGYLENVTNMLARIYAECTKKPITKIRAMMDEETYLFGSQAIDEEFASETFDTESEEKKEDAVALAQLELEDCINKMKNFKEDEKLVAQFADFTAFNNEKSPAKSAGIKISEDKRMDLEKLKNEYPDVYAQAVNVGVEKEQKRVKAHAAIAEKNPKLAELAMKNIADGKSIADEEVQGAYLAAKLEGDTLKARTDDNVSANVDTSGKKHDSSVDLDAWGKELAEMNDVQGVK